MKLPIRLATILLIAFARCETAHADAATLASDPESNPVPDDTRDFIKRLDIASGKARDADLARHGDPATVERIRKEAEAGDADGQFYLALLYKDGKGVAQDDAQYASWLRKAAEQDHVGAQVRLIGLYEKGRGVPRNLGSAAGWARRAAENGDTTGQGELVLFYYYGRGVEKDYVQAVKWLTVAKASGRFNDSEQFFEQIRKRATPAQVAEGETLAHEWLEEHRPKN